MSERSRLRLHRGGRAARPAFEAPDDATVPTLGWTLDEKYSEAREALTLVRAIGWERARTLARETRRAKAGAP